MKCKFTKDDTLFAKGIALCLLLIHHLFFGPHSGVVGIIVAGIEVSALLSMLARVCVAIFLILSGYGLGESIKQKKESVFKFCLRHIKKTYSNYWFIWIIFVPIGIFFFHRTFESIYGAHYFWRLIVNLLGMQELFGFYGYNVTWWFVTLIVLLYILFPFLLKLVEKLGFLSLVLFFLLMYVNKIVPVERIPILNTLYIYSFFFVLGLYLSKVDGIARFKSFWFKRPYKWLSFPVLLVTISILRLCIQMRFNVFTALKMDAFYGLLLIYSGYEFFQHVWFYNTMRFIGAHLFNIFLFHAFIFSIYFASFIYWWKYPPVIFFVLLSICLMISVLLNKLRTLIQFVYKELIDVIQPMTA